MMLGTREGEGTSLEEKRSYLAVERRTHHDPSQVVGSENGAPCCRHGELGSLHGRRSPGTGRGRSNPLQVLVVTPAGPPIKQTVTLSDAFGTDLAATVQTSHYLCTPTTKIHNGTTYVPDPLAQDLKCYHIRPSTGALKNDVSLSDQFRTDDLVTVTTPHLLCAPAVRNGFPD